MAFPKLISREGQMPSLDADDATTTATTRDASPVTRDQTIGSTGDEKLDTLAALLKAQLRDSNIAPTALHAIRFSRSKEGYDPRQVDETMEAIERGASQLIEAVETFITYATMSLVALRDVGSPTNPPINTSPYTPSVTQPAPTESITELEPEPEPQSTNHTLPEAQSSTGTAWSTIEIAETLLTAQRMANTLVAEAREQANEIISDAQDQADKIVSNANEEEKEIRSTIETLTATVHELEESSSHWEDILNEHIAELDSAYSSFMSETHHRLLDSIATNVSVQPSLSSGKNHGDPPPSK